MPSSFSTRTISPGALLVALAALIGAALALYSYLTPMTGVTGTPGALLVVLSSIALLVDGIILWVWPRGAVYWIFAVLGLLGFVGTLAAGWFLHEWLLMAAMVGVLVGLVVSMFARPARAA